ncbi:MAG: DUF1552 domain-containing protein [Myxococcota bacterium]
MLRRFESSRRALLRGAGATIALPFLPSLWSKSARADDTPPVRLLFWYVANGMHMQDFTPTGTGAEYDLPLILEPLASVQSHVSVLSGLSNMAGRDNRPGDHARGTGCFLTCETPKYTSSADIENGISVDQVAAQALGSETLFPSLQFGMSGGGSTGSCDSGYSCAYARNISWSGPNTPLPKIHDPKTAFDRLFSGLDTSISREEVERRRALRLSVLDAVAADAQSLQGQLGRSDSQKLDEYLTGVRELELRVENLDEQVCLPPERPESGLSVPQEALIWNELMAVAFECDLTRVMTYMFANAGSGRSHTFLNAAGNHHGISHHQGLESNYALLRIIDRWEIEMFADFIGRLATIEEANGSYLIDNSLVVLSSEISDGNRHNHDDLPVLFAGSGGGAHTPGRHLVYEDREPIANLYLSMLDAFGAPQSAFGSDGTRLLSGLV